jgi:hypothetical protein
MLCFLNPLPDASDVRGERLVALDHPLYLLDPMQNGGVIPTAEATPDFGQRLPGQNLGQIHRDVPGQGDGY